LIRGLGFSHGLEWELAPRFSTPAMHGHQKNVRQALTLPKQAFKGRGPLI
jgi:hypothetical protein